MRFTLLFCGIAMAVLVVDSQAQNVGCKNMLAFQSQFVSPLGSTYVPMDSWIYPAMDRLRGLGYLDTAFLGMRPWTRMSIVHMLMATADKIADVKDDSEACKIYHSLEREFQPRC